MKIYLGAVLLFVASVSEIKATADVQKNIKECIAEAKVPSDLQDISLHNPIGLLSNPKLKCFSACMMKKKGNIKNGRIDTQQQLQELLIESPDAYEILKDIVAVCSDLANQIEDECEVADSYVKCIIKHISIY